MTLASQVKMRACQFLQLGEDPPGVRLELVHGEIKVSPSPSYLHSHVVARLSRLLLNHVIAHDLGNVVSDVDTIFDEHNVRRPDLLFIRKDRLAQITGRAVTIAPDLCIEILSPTSATIDQVDKFDLYARHGVPHYWIVDPKGRYLEGYQLENGRYRLVGSARGEETVKLPPFAELAIPLAELWPTFAVE